MLPAEQSPAPERRLQYGASSEQQLQRKLGVTGIRRRRDPACRRRDADVARRQSEVGVIQDVEDLRPKVQAQTLRNSELLEHCRIPVEEAWPEEQVASGIAV